MEVLALHSSIQETSIANTQHSCVVHAKESRLAAIVIEIAQFHFRFLENL